MDYAEVGVKHYKTSPKSNQFISNKNGLSGSEWVTWIKLSCGYANLAGVPGASQAPNRSCRRCNHENETISHVLGACPFGANRRDARHHTLKHRLAGMIREKGFHTVDEAACKDINGSNRFIDILAFDQESDRAYIIDPTSQYL